MTDQLSLFGGLDDTPQAPAPLGGAPVPDEQLEAARRLPGELRLGTSSWSFPGWEGLVYDRAAKSEELAKDGLRAYAEHPLLRTVGIDRTYYAPIAPDVYARYAEAVPADFRFLAKAGQALVDPVTRSGQDNPTFLDVGYALDRVVGPFVEGLGAKAGPLLLQFPPLDLRLLGGAGAFVERLHAFLRALPRGPHYAVELRTQAAFTPGYLDALADVGASHCFNGHPSMPPIAAQARQAMRAVGPGLVVRWMLARGRSYQQAREAYAPFDRLAEADPQTRGQIADLAGEALRAGRRVFVVVNNKAEGCSPLSVAALAQQIARALR